MNQCCDNVKIEPNKRLCEVFSRLVSLVLVVMAATGLGCGSSGRLRRFSAHTLAYWRLPPAVSHLPSTFPSFNCLTFWLFRVQVQSRFFFWFQRWDDDIR
ncbi:hypothetical protein B0T24DRAFT_165016 [Lasiosphaeria ovina]|uniref:Uncharacterized protein n=1 Tax=Lasiosphaeria ovina TaxID=92902 RepID=A0AAE0NDT6_9PEZI|nr:hypothetical protein B0T24DRAFT_165016 [Lasiosphaeria ovina]